MVESPQVQEVWLVRHGVTASNQDRVIQGQSDVALAPEGVAQSEALARWMVARTLRFDAAVSSPLQRALQTATALQGALGLEPHLEPRFMEVNYGDWQGLSYEEMATARAQCGGDPYAVTPPGGESVQRMGERVCTAFDEWVAREEVGSRLLVVSHGGPINALVLRALGLPVTQASSRRYRRDNTGVTVLVRRPARPTEFLVAMLNSTAHLDQA